MSGREPARPAEKDEASRAMRESSKRHSTAAVARKELDGIDNDTALNKLYLRYEASGKPIWYQASSKLWGATPQFAIVVPTK